MNVPAGYTELDLVGFTDKGYYDASETYIKNDLALYQGTLWRCLKDDLTGVAPSEGENWTAFIASAGGVNSWNGRSGSVLPMAGDYTAEQVSYTPVGGVASNVKVQLDKRFVIGGQHLPKNSWVSSNSKWVQVKTDSRITANSFCFVYFNEDSLSAAAAANIVVDSYTGTGGASGGIQFTADSVPVMTADADLVCDIVVTNP